jgi:hypothetical protein
LLVGFGVVAARGGVVAAGCADGTDQRPSAMLRRRTFTVQG